MSAFAAPAEDVPESVETVDNDFVTTDQETDAGADGGSQGNSEGTGGGGEDTGCDDAIIAMKMAKMAMSCLAVERDLSAKTETVAKADRGCQDNLSDAKGTNKDNCAGGSKDTGGIKGTNVGECASGAEDTKSFQVVSGLRGGVDRDEVMQDFLDRRSRQEKKAKKILAKLGLLPVPGIKRVAIRKTDQTQFIVINPEVFKNPTSESYVVFGNWQVQDLNQKARAEEAQMLREVQISEDELMDIPAEEYRQAYDEYCNKINYHGVNKIDVDLICKQVNVDEWTAINALLKNNHDIVNTIMDLTQS